MEEKGTQSGDGLECLKRVRSEGCVLRRQQLVRNSPLPITSCYTLDEVIGLGSFACRVYRATDILSGVRRVVKRVSRDQPEGVRILRNEVTFLRRAHHPNIVRLFEVFEDPDAVYHVTETCYGGDLHQWLDRRLRRRQRHSRRRTVSFCSINDNNPAELQQHLQEEQQQQGQQIGGSPVDPELAQPSSAPTAATATAATTPNSVEGYSSNSLSPVAASFNRRAGSSMRVACPVAAGAAAAAATVAAAAAGLAASSLSPSSSPTAAGPSGPAAAAPGSRPLVSEEMAAQIAGQLLCALRYLHSREIAHCDVKLENILLAAELDDSEATGDGASSEEEEAALMQQQELQLQQQQLLQQEQERNTYATNRARPGLRRPTGHSSSSINNSSSSSSSNALAVVPMVLRKRRGLGGGEGERSECRDRDKETDRNSRNLSLPNARDSPSDSTHSLAGKFRRKNIIVKLADFGLAKKIVRGRPRQKVCPRLSVEGTLYYRSPWQILHGVEGDERSDLWALGVALFILFSGHPPFNGDDKASIDRAITDTPVSFSGGVWASLSLPCLGFLRALLYNPLLPLHLRGPPPPPPYGQPTAERMLKHPWLQHCFREERRRLMRAVSAPSINFLGDPSPTSVASSGGGSSPFSSHASLLSPSVSRSSLQHARRAPSDPSVQTGWLPFKPQDNARELQASVSRAASDPPLLQHFKQAHSAPAAAGGTTTTVAGRRGSVSCCVCCSSWRCPFGCATLPRQQKEFNKLRICWGRAPLVAWDEMLLPQQQQQKRARPPPSEGGVGDLVVAAEHEEEKPLGSAEANIDRSKQTSKEINSEEKDEDSNSDKKCCVLQAFGVRALRCVSCEGEEALNFLSECSSDWRGLPECSTQQLQPHVRLTCPISGLLGLESCVAATNAAAAAAAAAAGVAKAVHREAAAHLQGPQQGPPLENVPHFHLPALTAPLSTVFSNSSSKSRCYCSSGDCEFNKRAEGTDAVPLSVCGRCASTSRNRSSSRSCCIAVADWLMVELFEARVLLLLLAAAWLEFASLSPLQKALRSVVAKLMENDELFRPVRDVLWVLDPQQTGHVSWHCLLDSLKVVRDFFRLEAFLRDGDQNNSDTPSTVAGLRQPHPSGNSSNSMSSNLPASPLQTILAFAGLSAGEGPQLSDLLPFCEVLDNALAQTATLSNDANSSFVPVETHPCGQFHQPREGTPEQAEEERLAGRATTAAGAVGRTGGPSCLMEEALVCLDTDGSGSVEFDEFLAASMTRLDFLERKPTCSVAFRLLDRNVDGFVSANDLLTILHFDSKSDLQGVYEAQKKRADAAVASLLSATAAAAATGDPLPPGSVLDEAELVSGVDDQGIAFQVPAGAAYILQLEGVTAATAPVYVQVVRELKATQPNANGLWSFEDFMNLL